MRIRLDATLIGLTCLALMSAYARGEEPYKTRREILEYARTGIGSPYVWGGGNWDPDDRDWGGADCSGFVSKSWSISFTPKWTPYRVDLHGYSTGHYIQTPGAYWYEVDRADLIYGDAIVYRYDTSSGHTYIYVSGDGWGSHEVYEARGTAYGIIHRWKTIDSGMYAVKGIRRTSLIENVDVTEHIVEVDDGYPYYDDTNMDGSSSYDSHALGCKEGDCRYRWVSSYRNQTCTYTPNLPEAGWYRVYVTCGMGSSNVSGVNVTVNHANGSDSYTWDQADEDAVHTWVPMGDRSFLFSAGMVNNVVWDDFDATPTTEDHVFRGDATKFVLENRVEVDGVGGVPGKFATVSAALAWVKAHESEEPDVINITCNRVFEPNCVEIDCWDNLTINGDADNDGTPATLVITPSTPTDWSYDCGVYLNVPIQREYELRDLVIIPSFIAAGNVTGAYGLVLDEQNPSGEACATSVVLENISVFGSLAGNVPTDPAVESESQATMFGGTHWDYGASVVQLGSDWAGDDFCRQSLVARNLRIDHVATRGVVLQAAYADWDIDGGLFVGRTSWGGLVARELNDCPFTIRDSSGTNPNRFVYNDGSSLELSGSGNEAVRVENCLFRDNAGGQGVVSLSNVSASIENCFFVDNVAFGLGSAVNTYSAGAVSLSGCTIANNSGGANALYQSNVSMTVADSIIWGNEGVQVGDGIVVNYSNVEGGFEGTGNIHRNPHFVNQDEGDYHLAWGSPCINTGDPYYAAMNSYADVDGDIRPKCQRIDMGADETGLWNGDFNRDGAVDTWDFSIFQGCLSGPGQTPVSTGSATSAQCLESFDHDNDGDVDLSDFSVFVMPF